MNRQIATHNGIALSYKVRQGNSIRIPHHSSIGVALGVAVAASGAPNYVSTNEFTLPGIARMPHIPARLVRIELSGRTDTKFGRGSFVAIVIGHYDNGRRITRVIDDNTPEDASLGLPSAI